MAADIQLFSSKEEKQRVIGGAKAVAGIYLSIVMWVGAWELIAVTPREGRPDRHEYFKPHLLPRPLAFTLSGLVIMAISDTLYSNAGLGGTYMPRVAHENKVLRWVRTTVGMWGAFMFWIGNYDMLDLHVWSQSFTRDITFVVIGFAILFITKTLWGMSYVYPAEQETDTPDPTDESSFTDHFLHTVRSVVSMFGQNFIWSGAYNILSADMPGYSSADTACENVYNIAYLLFGLLLITVTRTTKALSWLPSLKFEDEEQNHSLTLYLRAITAIVGQVVSNTGFWNLIGSADPKTNHLRYVLFLFGGALGLFILGGLPANAGVNEPDGGSGGEGDEDSGVMKELLDPLQQKLV